MVRYWLANEDRYMSGYVRKYLETTPFDEASNDLELIASSAGREPHSLFDALLGGFLQVFTTAESVNESSPAGRKAGIRAALLLAHRQDPRCLSPLVRSLELGIFWAGAHQRRMEEALILFLESSPKAIGLTPYSKTLNDLVKLIWRSRSLRNDLSKKRISLLLLSSDWLKRIGGVKGRELLVEIATAKTSQHGRRQAQDHINSLLSGNPGN